MTRKRKTHKYMSTCCWLHESSPSRSHKKSWAVRELSNRNKKCSCVCLCFRFVLFCLTLYLRYDLLWFWCVITNYKRFFKNLSLPVFSSFVKQKQKITILSFFLWSETIYINEALFHNFSGCFPNGNNYREGGINRTYIQTCILFLSLSFL